MLYGTQDENSTLAPNQSITFNKIHEQLFRIRFHAESILSQHDSIDYEGRKKTKRADETSLTTALKTTPHRP